MRLVKFGVLVSALLGCLLGPSIAGAEINDLALMTPAPLGNGDVYVAPGQPVSFTAGGQGNFFSTDVVSMTWDWGDGSTNTTNANVPLDLNAQTYSDTESHTYAASATPYTLTISDDDMDECTGGSCPIDEGGFTQTYTVYVTSDVSVTSTQSTPVIGESDTFAAQGENIPSDSGSCDTYAFATQDANGNPGPSQAASASSTFAASFDSAGTWTVTATCNYTDQNVQDSITGSATVTVSPDLTATVSGPSHAYPGDSVTFNATAAGGYVTGQAGYQYVWSIDGQMQQIATTSTSLSTSSLPAGQHTISVTIYDDAVPEHTATDSATVTIVSPLSVGVTGPRTGFAGDQLTYTATASGGVTGATGYQYAWTVDGAPQSATGPTFAWTAAGTGTRTIGVTVSDDSSPAHTASASTLVTLGNALGATVTGPTSAWTGGPVTYTANPTGGAVDSAAGYRYQWALDGTAQTASGPTLSTSWSTAGSHTVSLTVTDSASPHPNSVTATLDANVTAVSPKLVVNNGNNPLATQTVSVDASGSTGFPAGAAYYYDYGDDNGTFDVGPSTVQHAWAVGGNYTVRMYVEDFATGRISATVTQAITVDPCTSSVAFGLVHATASGSGCMHQLDVAGQTEYQATGSGFRLNGLPLPATVGGTPVTLIPPSAASPGGQIELPASTISLPAGPTSIAIPIPSAARTLDLPAPGSDGTGLGYATAGGKQLSVSPSGSIGGFSVGGSIGIEFGHDAGGYYTVLPLEISLPKIFSSGPDDPTGVTTDVNLKIADDGHVELNKLKIDVTNVYLGPVKLDELCFFYGHPQSGDTTCPQVTLGDASFPSCSPVQQAGSEYWSGYASVELTDVFSAQLGAGVGVTSQRVISLQYLAGSLSDLKVEIAPDIFLSGISLGYCAGPPMQFDGGLQFSAFPTGDDTNPYLLTMTATAVYTAAFGGNPWSLAVNGTVDVLGTQVGSGDITLDGLGDVGFDAQLGVSLANGVISLNGGVDGWVEPDVQRFNVSGYVNGCLGGFCVGVNGVVSNVGVAGCVNLWLFSVGGGYNWSTHQVTLFGGSCDLSPWSSTQATASAATRSFDVQPRTRAIAVRLSGAGGIPHVRFVGPRGEVVTPQTKLPGTLVRNSYWAIPTPSDNELSVLIKAPRAGIWKVETLPGSAPVTAMALAHAEPAPVVKAFAHQLHNGRVRVKLAYWLPAGETMRVEAHATKGAAQPVVNRAGGEACATPARAPRRPGGYRCQTVVFQPLVARRLARTFTAIISRSTGPIENINVGSLKLRPFPHATPVVKVARRGSRLIVTWRRAPGATSYAAAVKESNGISEPLAVHGRRAIVSDVGQDVTATVTVWSIQPGDIVSRPAKVTVKPSTKHRKKTPKHRKTTGKHHKVTPRR